MSLEHSVQLQPGYRELLERWDVHILDTGAASARCSLVRTLTGIQSSIMRMCTSALRVNTTSNHSAIASNTACGSSALQRGLFRGSGLHTCLSQELKGFWERFVPSITFPGAE
jgi:hypothetical protein